jgi:pimeloyl-ACP methyl ester carboxylesterase
MGSEVRYADNDGVNLAYRVFGDGPLDILFVPPWFSNLDLLDDLEPFQRAITSVTSIPARLIALDRRGAGLSDRLCGPATLEEGIDDLLAVLDAVGSKQPVVFGFNESGTLCMLLAATHPTRTRALVLYDSFPSTTWQPDYPWGQKPEAREAEVKVMIDSWGTIPEILSPFTSISDNPGFLEWAGKWQRNSVSRDALPRVFDMLAKTDVRHVLGSINVPTLVLHRKDDPVVTVENGRYLGDNIPNAKYVELEGHEPVPFLGNWEEVSEEVEEFLTGTRRPRDVERVLATLVFTDIVGSTEKAASMGDSQWRKVLEHYDRTVEGEVTRYQGRVVKQLGDGHLLAFDGPARALKCACTISNKVKSLGVEVRAGLHTGEVEQRENDVGGIAVHIGSRVMHLAGPNEVLASASVPPLVAGSGISFEDRGEHELKGIDGAWKVFAVNA